MGVRRSIDEAWTDLSGYEWLETVTGRALVHSAFATSLLEAGILEPGGLLRRVAVRDTYQGRGSTAIVEVDGAAFVVRRFLPGGLLRRVRRPVFRHWRRPFRELQLMVDMRRAGLHTLEPVAAIARRVRGGHELELVTARLQPSRELLDVLGDRTTSRRMRYRILRAAGRELAVFHGAGFEHADLHLKNFLVSDEDVYIIDLDRSRAHARIERSTRLRNLTRLWRYAERRARYGVLPSIDVREVLAFLRGYESDGPRRRAWYRSIRRRHAWTRPLHALGWWFAGKPPEAQTSGR